MPTNFPEEPDSRGRKGINNYRGWGIPAFFAVLVLLSAFVIFSSAGPDRTRTADNNNQSPAVTAPAPTTGESIPAQKPVPSKSNTPGTQ